MTAQLRIGVYKDRYPSSFAVPRASSHDVQARTFLTPGKAIRSLDGLAFYPGFGRDDLMHAFNRVPLAHSRYIITFESHLPRVFGLPPGSMAEKLMRRDIASNRCRRIIGLSHFAARKFLHQNRDAPELEALERKLMVRYPNVMVPETEDLLAEPLSRGAPDQLELTFVGGHFARKGGCAVLRFAEEAQRLGLPVQINIVSAMQMGREVWTDPSNPAFFAPYLKLLDLPNVTHYRGLSNDKVLALLARSHFQIMPTFSDTFGFSIIEAMAHHTPTIATRVQAIPEMIVDEVTGLLLDLPVDETGYWVAPPYSMRGEASYESHFRESTETLVTQIVDRVSAILTRPDQILAMRRNARKAAETTFSAATSRAFYDPFYLRVAGEDVRKQPARDPVLDVSSQPVGGSL